MKPGCYRAVVPALALAIAAAAGRAAFAAGGQVVFRTDDSYDGYYLALGGSGSDRFINEYAADAFDPGAVLCGARFRELNQGTIPPPGMAGCEVRLEDPANPGHPSLVGPPYASAANPSLGACSASASVPRFFTFGGGGGVPDPMTKHYVCAIEPPRGLGPLDFCGCLADTSGPVQGFSQVHSGGVFSAVGFNLFVEEVVFTSRRVDLNIRASGSQRFPGDPGDPIVYTTRPNAGATVTDDSMTIAISIDNNTGGPLTRNLSICADQNVVVPGKGVKAITGFFRPTGGGSAIMNPVFLPAGRTVLLLEAASASLQSKAANIVNKRVLNLPLLVSCDDPALDVDPCRLEGAIDVDDERTLLGLRRRAGSADDESIEQLLTVQTPSQIGDALNVRLRAIDLPKVPYRVSGFEVIGGDVGGAGPGLDAVELRTEDPILRGSPDLSFSGMIRTFGVADGIGSIVLGPAPASRVLNSVDVSIDPTLAPQPLDFFVVGLFVPGQTSPRTTIGADGAPFQTILGDSSMTSGGLGPARKIEVNIALRAMLDGDKFTIEGGPKPPEIIENAVVRDAERFVPIDRFGEIIR